jgi:hypothetical protein
MKKHFIIILVIALTLPYIMFGQKAKSIASIDKDTILIGDQLKLQLEVKTDKDTKITWPAFKDLLVEGIEIIEQNPIDTLKQEDGSISYIQNFIITSFDTGFYEIPGFNFACLNQIDTSFYKSLSNPLFLRVNTIAIDTTQVFKPIKGPISQGYTFVEALPYIGGFILFIGILFAIYYFFFRKKDEALFVAKPKLKIAAHIIALSRLEELKDKKLWQDNRFKDYYTELTDIFRIYIEDRFGVDALEMTSDEIRESMKSLKDVNDKLKNKISETLTTSDFVKFAKMNPTPEDNTNSMSNVIEFVKNTAKIIEKENKKAAETIKQIEEKTETRIKG